MTPLDKFKKFLGWRDTSKPHITLNDEFYAHLAPFRLPLILTVLMMLIGTIGYMAIDNFSLMNAIYQSGITFTTVGFGEISPISDMGRIFTITLIIFGFIVFSIAIGIIVEVVKRGEFQKTIKERRMLYEIARLKRHFVVCYHNEFTIQVTRQLRANHIPFVVVDPREDLEALAKKYHYPYFVSAEPHTEEGILKSHLSSAKGVITLADNVADNIATIASARLYETEIGRTRKFLIIANAKNHEDDQKLQKLGADKVVTATKLMAQRINAMAARPEMENLLQEFLYKKDTPLDMEEANVSKTSWLALKKIKVARFRDIANVTIIGIRQKDNKFIPMPKGDTIIMPESKLLLIGTSEGISKAKKIIHKKEKPEELKYV
ncbi:MAG TPA: NAD-binding protein [Sulfurovum sp.]|nr:MAG: potassium channel protein [Sulfurovum sp. 35-42-20]OYZ26881.1 MAG: potassium channel protein [Sulfurovum sp. 16-42-52]OYZ49540.1 MAG: potassium channel protein [Sulfurovum sp. 24-42-9]OZA45880.1 MAG: potassium channel protein [Sulfurovum sp. 17-42-90]OZA59894.1 MAG: potassium channel protein [Sulfurovum sp. 39-42-12]HQR73155.1 NAD-binding protein [Sulfurovum sp.]